MHAKAILWALVAVRAAAQNYPFPLITIGGQGVVFGNNSKAAEVVAAAGRHPNATHEVTFQRTGANDGQQTWTWRINVTTLAIPKSLPDLGKPSADYSDGWYVTNSQWQLEWPKSKNGESQSLQSFLSNGNQTLQAYFMTIDVPSSLSPNDDLPSDGSCEPVLGSDCTNSVRQAASARNFPVFTGLSGCKDTLDKGLSNSIYSVSGGRWSANSDGTPFQPDDTFYAQTSRAFHAGNMTEYDSATRSLQILTLAFSPYGFDGQNSPSVLCQIVDHRSSSSAATLLRPLTVTSCVGVAVSLLLAMM